MREGSGVVPKASVVESNIDWLRTRKLAAAAMLDQLLLDPYRRPDEFVHTFEQFEKRCSLCESSERAQDWPGAFEEWHDGSYSLMDDYYIESTDPGIVREVGAPQSVQRLDVADLFEKKLLHKQTVQAWAKSGAIPKYMSVVHDGARYLLYVPDFPLPEAPQSDSCAISLATSVDGIKWAAEPSLHDSGCGREGKQQHAVTLTDFGIYTDGEFCVTHHPTDGGGYRFKMGYQCGVMEVCVAYSHDGRRWHSYNNNRPVFGRGSDTYLCIHHVANVTYTLFGRAELTTDVGWREIRGVNMATGELRFDQDIARRELAALGTQSPTPLATTWREWRGSKVREEKEEWGSRPPLQQQYPLALVKQFHLDGQGKLERYRRQLYRSYLRYIHVLLELLTRSTVQLLPAPLRPTNHSRSRSHSRAAACSSLHRRGPGPGVSERA
jgi:hypothetical protein